MQTLPDSLTSQFRYHWKELRKSDPRLAREFGLNIGEVRRIKAMLIGNSHANSFIEEDEIIDPRPGPVAPRPAFEREAPVVSAPSGQPRISEQQHKGLLATVFSGWTQSTAKVGKGVFQRVSGLVFEEDEQARLNAARIQPQRKIFEEQLRAPVAAEKKSYQESDPWEKDRGNGAGHPREEPESDEAAFENSRVEIDKASNALHKVQETVEKVEFEQELERRVSALAAKVAPEKFDIPAISEPPREIRIAPREDDQIVFKSAVDEVLYKQALKKLLHEHKEIRCKGIIEIERIGQKNKTAAQALIPLMQDDESDVRAQVLISLISLDAVDSIPLFKAALSDENARVRMAAIRGIHKFTGRTTSQFLSLALTDECTEVREISARYIGMNGDNVSISSIIELLGKENNPSVRKTLMHTLIAVRDKSTIPCFISLLNDSTPELRRMAAGTLEQWTGKKFGFNPVGPLTEREKGIEEIKRWWFMEKEAFKIQPKSGQHEKQEQKKAVIKTVISGATDATNPSPEKEPILRALDSVTKPTRASIAVESKTNERPVSPAPAPKPADTAAGPEQPDLFKIMPENVPKKAHHPADIKAAAEPEKTHRSEGQSNKRRRSIKLDADALGFN